MRKCVQCVRIRNGKRGGKKLNSWIKIAAPWEITRVKYPAAGGGVLNARIMKMPIRSRDPGYWSLALDSKHDTRIFVNTECNQCDFSLRRNLQVFVSNISISRIVTCTKMVLKC